MPDTRPIEILLVGGGTRSGTTIVDRILGSQPGYWSLGEFRWVWRRGLARNERCGCGEPFRDCPFWRRVFDRAFGGMERLDGDALASAMAELSRERFWPLLLWPKLPRPRAYQASYDQYAEAMTALYRAVVEESGAQVLVDSTKHPRFTVLHASLPDVRMRAIQMVRDSRAVAFSWQRPKLRPDIHWEEDRMNVRAARSCSNTWMRENGELQALRLRRTPIASVRYERFAREPRRTLESALQKLGLSPSLDAIDEGRVHLRPSHTVAGNPNRFETGETLIRPDDEYLAALSEDDWREVTRRTFPFLLAYGYPLRRPGGGGGAQPPE